MFFLTMVVLVVLGCYLIKRKKSQWGNIFNSVVSAVKGGAFKIGEEIVDENKLVIFEQKIRDGEGAIMKTENALTDVIASIKGEEREIENIDMRIAQNGEIIKGCLKKERKDLAIQVAEKVASLEDELESREISLKKLKKAEEVIRDKRLQMNDKLNEMRRNIILFKSKESVNNALKKTAELMGDGYTFDNESISSLAEQIDKRQDFEMDKINAKQKLVDDFNDVSLEDELKKEGLMKKQKSAEEVLKRYE